MFAYDLSFALHSVHFIENGVLICCYLVIPVTLIINIYITDLLVLLIAWLGIIFHKSVYATDIVFLLVMGLSLFQICDASFCASFQILGSYCFILPFQTKLHFMALLIIRANFLSCFLLRYGRLWSMNTLPSSALSTDKVFSFVDIFCFIEL